MITLTDRNSNQACDGFTRRGFLQVGALGALGVSLSHLMDARAAGAIAEGHDERSVIMIFNLGAPSQIDLFDPKPDAPPEIRGPFKTIATRSADIRLSELLPLHARVADKFSLVRSVHSTAPAVHDIGHQLMQTGRVFGGGVNAPHVGSAVQFLRGPRNGLPGHVVLPQAMGRTGGDRPHGQDAGFLGSHHDPFVLNADPAAEGLGRSDLPPPASIGEARVERGRKLRDVVDAAVKNFEASEDVPLMDRGFASAFNVTTSTRARDAFDLAKEPAAVRQRYGMTRFGQSCLLARRLVEAGVRFVTVNTFTTVFDEVTWDVHGSRPFTSFAGMEKVVCPMYDQGYSALIEDLDRRGMLNDTMVCNLAEFGRMPRINAAGGRDHWRQCWTVYFAGGGVQGGRVVGRSDAIGAYPADRPVTPAEVVATIYKSLGVALDTELPGQQGHSCPVVDCGTDAIDELF